MAITLNYEAVSDNMANGDSIQDAVASATGHDYFSDQKPENTVITGTEIFDFFKLLIEICLVEKST